MENKLSPRLQSIFSFLNGKETFADIGADHGYLVLEYVEKFQKSAYASEVAPGPFERLVKNINASPFKKKITCYMGNGFENLPNEVDTVAICGMGGLTILKILEKAIEHPNLKVAILEPQSHFYEIRFFCEHKSYKILCERYCEERGHIYPILEVALNQSRKLPQREFPFSEPELYFGRDPIQKKDLILQKYLQKVIETISPFYVEGKIDKKTEDLYKNAVLTLKIMKGALHEKSFDRRSGK